MTINTRISRRRMLQLAIGTTALGFATAATACSRSAAPGGAPATNIRLGYFPNLTHAPALVGAQEGLFQKSLGASVTIDTKSFNAGPALIEALLAGEIDLGYVGPNPAINGYTRSNGKALRIIAGAASGGALFIVRPEAAIAAPKDLAGKKFATPQRGGTQDVALRHYVRENGLKTADEGGDVSIVPTANQDILTLFKQGQIDGAWVPEPWATRLIQESGGAVFIDERTLWPDGKFVSTVVVARSAFLNEHPDQVRQFLTAHVGAIALIKSQPERAKTLANKEIERITTKALPAKVIDAALTNIDFTYEPLQSSLTAQADYAFDLGFLGASKPDLSGLYDLALLNEVVKAAP